MKEIIYIGFLMNYLDIDSIKKWADYQISINNIDGFLIEISTENDLISILKTEITNPKAINFYFKVYQELLFRGYSQWEIIQEEILKLYEYKFIKDNNDFFFSRLKDNYFLKKDGLSENMDMPNELFDFLNKYKNVKIDAIDLPLIIDYMNINEIL